MRKVIDGFTFFTEIELLEIRLNILYPYVDHFILVEASRTHSNKLKPFYFEENKEKFEKFLDKIIHIKVDFPENLGSHTWALENYQRECIKDGLSKIDGLQPNDILFISDLDEIPRPEIITSLRNDEREKFIGALKTNIYYFFLNLKFQEAQGCYYNFLYVPRFCTLSKIPEFNQSLQKIRVLPPEQCDIILENAGWHWSFLSDAKGIQEKIEAFAHQEHNNPKNTSLTNIKEKMKNGSDIFGRSFGWEKCEIDKTYPTYILENLEKFRKYIKL